MVEPAAMIAGTNGNLPGLEELAACATTRKCQTAAVTAMRRVTIRSPRPCILRVVLAEGGKLLRPQGFHQAGRHEVVAAPTTRRWRRAGSGAPSTWPRHDAAHRQLGRELVGHRAVLPSVTEVDHE